MDLVIGYQGKEHVTAGQVGRIVAGMAGDGVYVLGTQNKFAASMQTANQVRIDTGDLVVHGRVATVEVPETLTVESGVTGQKRNDLVIARYSKDPSSSVESCSLAVVKGTPVSYGDPTDPDLDDGSVLDGDSPVEVPLWRIPIDGLAPGTPVKLFDETPSIESLRDSVSQTSRELDGLREVEDPIQSYIFPDLPIFGTKVGNVATIFVESRSPVLLEAGFHTIGYLKPGCCPKTTTDVFWGTANVSGSTAWLMLRVGTDGKISTYMTYAPTSTTVSVMRASATFVTA